VRRAVAAVVAVVAVVAGAIWLVTRSQDSGPDPKAWEQKASAAFKPLVNDVPDLVQGARDWQAGQRPTDAFTAQVHTAVADFTRTADRVRALRASPKNKAAGELYWDSARLYVEVGRIYEVMVASEPGDIRPQLDLLARRARELGDRVFDRGHAVLTPYLDEQQSPDVEVRAPEEVPLWPEEGLAAGPPLDAVPPPAAASPPLRQQSRPEESAAAWAKDVRASHIPTDSEDLGPAIGRSERDRLGELARRYVAAAEYLRSRPDPKGERDKSAIFRLGLLVDADAARAAQAATYLQGEPRKELRNVAGRLLVIAGAIRAEGRP
jgi:hypothetical protein